MKIGIDGFFMVGKKTGMGVMLYNLLKHLSEDFLNNNCIYVYVPEPFSSVELQRKNIHIITLKKTNFVVWEQFKLRRAAIKDKIDVFWHPFNTGCLNMPCKRVVTIHDIIYMKSSFLSAKTMYKKMGQLYRKIIVPLIAKKAEVIITVSEFSQKELIDFFGNYVSEKSVIIYNSAEFKSFDNAHSEWIDLCKKNNIKKKYILAPGSLEKRKNVLRVIKAYDNLSNDTKKEYDLVLYGFKGWDESDEKQYVENNDICGVIVLGYVSDNMLCKLYSNAECFVFASTYEGFGIPIIEAMYFDTPVITSNVTCLPEIAGDAALYVDPYNVQDITSKMEMLLKTSDSKQALVKKLVFAGKKNLTRFSWKNSSKKLEKIFLNIKV